METTLAALPHVLLINIDDLGYTDLSYHGAEYNTSNLDYLALSGIDLTNYYVLMDCTPTRSSLITGRYPWRIGFQNPGTMACGTKAHIPFDTPTIAELMKIAGYNTQMIGKWHLGYAAFNTTPTGRGFNDYYGYYNGAEDYYTHQVDGGYDLVYNNKPQQQLNGTYNADLFFDYYFQYLSNNYKNSNMNNKEPLFMYLALQTIHAPIEKPPEININHKNMTELYDKQCAHINNTKRMWYCQKLLYIDVYIGDLIDLYKQLNLFENTLIIVTTDNGGMPAWNTSDHPHFNLSIGTSVGSNYPYRAGKITLFQGGMLGLSFVSGALIPEYLRGTKHDGLFHAMDWFPSILSFIGADSLVPNNLDGINIFDSILNNKTFNRTQLILFSNFDVEEDMTAGSLIQGAVINNEWKYIHGEQLYDCYYPAPPLIQICLQNDTTPNDKYLFNLKNDPYETTNLVQQHPLIVDQMIDLIVEDAINNGFEYNFLNVAWNSSCPKWHNGNWLPWLDYAPINDFAIGACPM